MALTAAQLRASRNYQRKKKVGNIVARHYIPIKQHNALKDLAEKTGKTLESLTIEFLAAGLKAKGYKL
jgi:hypothetical protein